MEGDTDMIYKTLSVAQEKLTMAEDRYKCVFSFALELMFCF